MTLPPFAARTLWQRRELRRSERQQADARPDVLQARRRRRRRRRCMAAARRRRHLLLGIQRGVQLRHVAQVRRVKVGGTAALRLLCRHLGLLLAHEPDAPREVGEAIVFVGRVAPVCSVKRVLAALLASEQSPDALRLARSAPCAPCGGVRFGPRAPDAVFVPAKDLLDLRARRP